MRRHSRGTLASRRSRTPAIPAAPRWPTIPGSKSTHWAGIQGFEAPVGQGSRELEKSGTLQTIENLLSRCVTYPNRREPLGSSARCALPRRMAGFLRRLEERSKESSRSSLAGRMDSVTTSISIFSKKAGPVPNFLLTRRMLEVIAARRRGPWRPCWRR